MEFFPWMQSFHWTGLVQGSPIRDSIGNLLYDTLRYQVKSVKSSEKLLWEMFVSLFVAWGFVLIQKCLNAYWLKRGGAKFKNRGYESQSELLLWFLFWRKLPLALGTNFLRFQTSCPFFARKFIRHVILVSLARPSEQVYETLFVARACVTSLSLFSSTPRDCLWRTD